MIDIKIGIYRVEYKYWNHSNISSTTNEIWYIMSLKYYRSNTATG